LAGLGVVLLFTLIVGTRLVSMDIGVVRLVAAVVGAVLLGLSIGALALAVGSATGKKGLAVGVASAVATTAYFVDSLAPQVDVHKALRPLSPFYYYSDGVAGRDRVPDRALCGAGGDHSDSRDDRGNLLRPPGHRGVDVLPSAHENRNQRLRDGAYSGDVTDGRERLARVAGGGLSGCGGSLGRRRFGGRGAFRTTSLLRTTGHDHWNTRRRQHGRYG
jgi:hypothetical protein